MNEVTAAASTFGSMLISAAYRFAESSSGKD